MTESTLKEVYRVPLGPNACRSAEALLAQGIVGIPGVDSAVAVEGDTLIALVRGGHDVFDEVIRVVVDAGLDPRGVTVSPLERVFDPAAITAAQAETLGLVSAPKQPVRAAVETVQRVRVTVTDGYDPEVILIEAGVPAEIAFSEGHGCLGTVVFDSLGIEADLERGGAVVRIPALEPGTYPFRCGMDMVHGTLIVE